MSVRFKFKNDREFSAVPCDGFHISVRDLKRAIVARKRLGRETDFDLEVINQHEDGEAAPYTDEEALIPKNSTLIIVRKPLERGQKKVWEDDYKSATSAAATASGGNSSVAASVSAFSGSATADLTEDDKIQSMMSSAAEMYDEKHWVRYRGKQLYGSRPPPKYVCMRCHQEGHWATDCPLARSGPNGTEVKRTTGIPRSFLKPATLDTPGAKINPQGEREKKKQTEVVGLQLLYAGTPATTMVRL